MGTFKPFLGEPIEVRGVNFLISLEPKIVVSLIITDNKDNICVSLSKYRRTCPQDKIQYENGLQNTEVINLSA